MNEPGSECDQFSKMSYEEVHRALLVTSSERLVRFLQLNVPKLMITNEVSILFRRALGYLGPDLFAQLGREFIDQDRQVRKFCRECGKRCGDTINFELEAGLVVVGFCPECVVATLERKPEP